MRYSQSLRKDINYNLDTFKFIKHPRINYFTDGDIVVLKYFPGVSFPLKTFKRKILKPFGFVYIITNNVNGKVYIGKTTKYPIDRYISHTKADSLIGSAIKKYGEDNFSFDIIKICHTPEKLAKQELKQICRFKSYDRKFGYNIRIASNIYVKPDSPKNCNRLGENNGMYGKGDILRGRKRPDQSNFMKENNPMKNRSLQSVWIEKYGEEEALIREQKWIENKNNTYNNIPEERKQEINKLKARPGEKNGMYGKSLMDVWIEKYGYEEACIRNEKRISKMLESSKKRKDELKANRE